MGKRLKDKVAVVTGSGRGIGRSEALLLAEEGAKVVVNDLGVERDGTGAGESRSVADEVVAEINKMGGEAVSNYDSVSTSEGAERIIKTALDSFGRLDILVNNAGILRDCMVFNIIDEDFDQVIKVHLYGHFYCGRAACRIFRKQNSGRIINTSSPAAFGHIGLTDYSAAKAGIIGLTKTWAKEMEKYGVTCNVILPGAATRMLIIPEEVKKWERTGVLQKRLNTLEKLGPERIAPLVAYLASDEAAHINGMLFFVAGEELGIYSEFAPEKLMQREGGWSLDALVKSMPSLVRPKTSRVWPE